MSMKDEYLPPFAHDDVEVIETETPFRGFFRVDKLTLRHRAYEGGWAKPITREVFVRGEAAAVLPYDPLRQEILMVEQFRAGAYGWRESPWCLELIAGIADKPGEPLEDLVAREAIEEAGITLTDIEKLCYYMPSPGGSDERLGVFVARADLTHAGGIHGQPDEGEDIRVVKVAVADIPELLASSLLDNAASIVALQWLLLHKSALDARWCPGA